MPDTAAENEALVEQLRADREEACAALIGAAQRLGCKVALGTDATALFEEREFRAGRRRVKGS